jgi:nitroreductase
VELTEVVRRRRMVRRFARRPVPPETIDRILDLARRAPTAGFAQGVDFLVLDTPAAVASFWEITDDPSFPTDPEDIAGGPR